MTYSDLVTAVSDWLHREGDADFAAFVPDFLRFAELRIYRDLRVRAMEASLSSAMSSGTLAVPAGYVSMKYAYINGSPTSKLQRKDAEWIYHNYPTRSVDASPKFFARDGEYFIFGPFPDADYTVKGTYYKRLDELSYSNTTNWFTDNAPDLLLAAAMLEAQTFALNDQRTPVWQARYDAIGARIQREDDAEEFSGSPLVMTQR